MKPFYLVFNPARAEAERVALLDPFLTHYSRSAGTHYGERGMIGRRIVESFARQEAEETGSEPKIKPLPGHTIIEE